MSLSVVMVEFVRFAALGVEWEAAIEVDRRYRIGGRIAGVISIGCVTPGAGELAGVALGDDGTARIALTLGHLCLCQFGEGKTFWEAIANAHAVLRSPPARLIAAAADAFSKRED